MEKKFINPPTLATPRGYTHVVTASGGKRSHKKTGSLILPVEDSIYSGISPRWAQTCDSLPDPETDAGRDGPG